VTGQLLFHSVFLSFCWFVCLFVSLFLCLLICLFPFNNKKKRMNEKKRTRKRFLKKKPEGERKEKNDLFLFLKWID